MQLRGMTYNLKFPSEDGPHAWSARRPLVAEVLRRTEPHILATQEGHFFQLRHLAADAPRPYEWIGLGRGGGGRGEFCAIFYDPQLLEPLEYDHFWLSARPDTVGSRSVTWLNQSIRMATWVRFAVRGAGELLWLNTHLDHQFEVARVKGARLIAARLAQFDPQLPVVVSGDFNCAATPTSGAFRELTAAGLVDSWTLADGPAVGSYGGWADPGPGERIDWLLVRGPGVQSVGTCTYHDGDRWPSDHVPVYADLTL